MIRAINALRRLRDGNLRFTSERRTSGKYLTEERRAEFSAYVARSKKASASIDSTRLFNLIAAR